MRFSMTGAALAAVLLAGCAEVKPVVMPLLASVEPLPISPPTAPVRVLPEPDPFEPEYTESPFQKGPVSVISADARGDMATWRLIPCQQGRAICVNGRPAQLSKAGDTYVVSGTHGVSFHLMTGGDGFVTHGGGKMAALQAPLAWEHFPAIGYVAQRRDIPLK
ncbi:MAG: hypothetical protein ACU0B9_13390 [Limimaricola soesokkakensis]|uniref:hypothetical protein n=1 Tax=Limimaricola soesokkakensis TaxID=1343159 RepID=UPI004059B854